MISTYISTKIGISPTVASVRVVIPLLMGFLNEPIHNCHGAGRVSLFHDPRGHLAGEKNAQETVSSTGKIDFFHVGKTAVYRKLLRLTKAKVYTTVCWCLLGHNSRDDVPAIYLTLEPEPTGCFSYLVPSSTSQWRLRKWMGKHDNEYLCAPAVAVRLCLIKESQTGHRRTYKYLGVKFEIWRAWIRRLKIHWIIYPLVAKVENSFCVLLVIFKFLL